MLDVSAIRDEDVYLDDYSVMRLLREEPSPVNSSNKQIEIESYFGDFEAHCMG